MKQMKDPLNLPKLTPKSEIFGGPEKGDFSFWYILSCILPHFAAHFAVFCGRLSHAKAVPLHRISKRAEIANK